MTQWHTIPQEILSIMLAFMDTRDMMQCQRVCRNWATISQSKAYTDVTIDYHNEMSGFLKINKSLGKRVKRLHIRNESFHVVRAKGVIKTCLIQFSSIFSPFIDISSLPATCPNLELLEFDQPESEYWEWIHTNCCLGYWKHLNRLPCPTVENTKAGEHYSKTIHLLSRNMKEINMFVYGTLTSTSQALMTDDFEQLETLQLGDLHPFPVHIDSLINKFPRLKRILIRSEYKDMGSYFDSQDVKPNLTVNEFGLIGTTLSVHVLFYIMKKFPHLKRLHHAPLSEPVEISQSPAVLEAFADYVQQLDSCRMELLSFETTEFIPVMADKLSDRHYCFELSARYYGLGQIYFNTSKVRIEKRLQKKEQEVVLQVLNKGQVFPFRDLARLNGHLTCLKFNHQTEFPSHFVNRVTEGDCFHRHSLEDITSTCPRLRELYLNRFYLIDCHLNEPSHSIRQLHLQRCHYLPQALFQLSQGLPQLELIQFAPLLVLDPVTLMPLSEDPDHVDIKMPFTSLSRLVLDDIRFPRRRKSIYLKLVTHHIQYYQIRDQQMTTIPSIDYQQAMKKSSHFSLCVQLKQLESIQMLGQTFAIV
ncbi:hypothetical protein BD560DRAFT_384279 [Blakeslea trispora]|nr:hypothetical protein BD560DRAFT_384279 [Blakeslea trispora]